MKDWLLETRDDKYCIDISNQILASIAILKKANQEVVKAHLECCVRDSFINNDNADEKINEVMSIINKLSKC